MKCFLLRHLKLNCSFPFKIFHNLFLETLIIRFLDIEDPQKLASTCDDAEILK